MKKNRWLFLLLLVFGYPHLLAARPELENEGAGGRIQFADPANITQAWSNFYQDWEGLLTFVIAFGILTALLAFIYLMIKLAMAGDNPFERQEVFKELLVLAVTTAILGAFGLAFITLMMTFLY